MGEFGDMREGAVGSDGWNEYKLLVVRQFEMLFENVKEIDMKINRLTQNIEDLKRDQSNTKTTVGVIAGGIGFALSLFAQYIIPILRDTAH